MKPGDPAPTFELPSDDGTTIRLADELAQGPVVLFFYPKAMTPGCTKESCHFRDLAAEFEEAGAQRVGISMDDVAKQKEFAELNKFDYPLLADVGGDVAEQYGVRRRFGPIPVKRHTFVIDTDREVIEVVKSEFSMNSHADKALAVLRKRATSGR